MTQQRRGRKVSVAGAVFQLVFTAVMLGIWLATGSVSAMNCMWMLAGGLMLWLMGIVLFYCRELERREAIELEDIAAGGGPVETIFKSEQDGELRPAAARVAFVERWIVPGFTLLWAAYHAGIALWMLRLLASMGKADALTNTAPAAVFAMLIAMAAFLLSRYCTGMGTLRQWRMLRAAGSYMLVNVLVIGAVVLSLVAAYQGYNKVDAALAYLVPLLQLVLALELAVNFLLDIYRPRVAGQEQHFSFDSRLFALVAQPGRLGHSIAETLNYQFGFEVSKTWFYRLLSMAMVPLIAVGGLILLAMTCIVLIYEGQQGILLRLGRADAAHEAVLEPGIHFKLPWPIDSVRTFNTSQVHEILLGAGEARSEEEIKRSYVKGHKLYLWTREHGDRTELNFLVAKPPEKPKPSDKPKPPDQPDQAKPDKDDTPPPPVDIIKLVVPVQYRIDDPYKFGFTARDAHKLLECVAYQEMVRYCASATLTSPVGAQQSDRPEAIMTYGRDAAARKLKQRIQKAARELNLGVEITYVGLVAVHPPPEVAPAYQKVLEAERRQDEQRFEAQANANEILANVAGTPGDAMTLALAIRTMDQLKDLRDRRQDHATVTKVLQGYTTRAQADLRDMEKDLRRQELLGKVAREDLAYRRRLVAHVSMLDRLRSERQDFAFDREIRLTEAEADKLFGRATGEPARRLAEAEAYRWTKEFRERARFESFEREMFAYRASPRVYVTDRYMDVLDSVLPYIPKYVLAVDPDQIETWVNHEHSSDPMAGAYQGQTVGQ